MIDSTSNCGTILSLPCFSLALASLAPGQQFGPQRVISNAADSARDVYAADLDGDGDFDVLSASTADDRIAWYENLGGHQFGPQRNLNLSANRATSVHAADLDGDGDMDALSGSGTGSSGRIDWYENNGGQPSGPRLVGTSAATPYDLHATDLDGDGDTDVLVASAGEIAWYENLANTGFGASRRITNAISAGESSVHAADVDGDGHADVLSTSGGDDKVAWYENLGGGVFGSQQVITLTANLPNSVHAADLDGDGDADVLSSSRLDNKIAWYPNQGGGVFGAPRVISTAAQFAYDAFAADLDGDGDLDVLSASAGDDKIAWYENLGGGVFGVQQVITTSAEQARSAFAVDLDGDGDADVLSASEEDDKIAWYENLDAGIGTRYPCPAVPNSTQRTGEILAEGSTTVFLNSLVLSAAYLPSNSFGYFITSQSQGITQSVSNSQGVLCINGSIGRLSGPGQILNSGSAGTFSLSVNLTAMPTPNGLVSVLPGESWNFQAWYRDANPSTTSNFTDAVSVMFR